MTQSIDLISFRNEILYEVNALANSGEDGGITEEKFTELIIDILTTAQQTENARECREIREDSIGRRLHKINGYALSENYETLDLFVCLFNGGKEIPKFHSEDVKAVVSQSTRFLKSSLNGYLDEIEETAPIFDFAKTIKNIQTELVRANIFIISDGQINTDSIADIEIRNILVKYHIRDIDYIHKISGSASGRLPIEVDFVNKYNTDISFLSVPSFVGDLETFLFVLPGEILSQIYLDYGSQLLEQNVRSFLQFRGKINKGIRDTLLTTPHMFFAYNNGITATASAVEMDDGQRRIVRIIDLQIVNGGQTTASLLHTYLKNKKSSIAGSFVQVKLTVIRDVSKRAEIVSKISRFANSQNKVSDADLTSNNPFHIKLEQLSRMIWTPDKSNSKKLTQWFYERARGQYNDQLGRAQTPTKKRSWIERHPKSQMFDKEELARYWMAWEKTPWWVVRGRQRNFLEFMKIAKQLRVDNVFFEDLIAKAILFKSAESLYGRGSNSMGDLRYIVVPYTISWLSQVTNGRLDLYKIWLNQKISPGLSVIIESALRSIDKYIRDTAPNGLLGEWGKKEECWTGLKGVVFDGTLILEDFSDEITIQKRHHWTDTEEQRVENISLQNELKSVSISEWKAIQEWGRLTGYINSYELGVLFSIEKKFRTFKDLTEIEIKNGKNIIDRVLREAPLILAKDQENPSMPIESNTSKYSIEFVQKIWDWERKHKKLFDKEANFLKKLIKSGAEPTEFQNKYIGKIFGKVKKYGFRLT